MAFAAIILIFCRCGSDDDYLSGDKPLSFSTDTIGFDTVFTQIGSATQQLKIYNRNNRSLNIQSVELESKGASGFRINLDGESGTSFSNVEILKNDSLFLFVEVTVDPLTSPDPVIRDSIRFTTNGITQYIQLEAIGLDVYKWKDKIIGQDTTITAHKPILVYSTLTIAEGVKLTVTESAVFYFRRNARMDVYGSVDMQGTASKPIVIRGDRFDKISENVYWDNVPGQWKGITFHPDSYNNAMQYVTIKNSTEGVVFYESDPSIKKATLEGVTIQNTSQTGLSAINSNIDAENCLLVNSGEATMKLIGGKYNFNFCTIANYYRWATRKAPTVVITNIFGISPRPLDECNIYNSIIYGSYSEELAIEGTNSAALNYRIASSIIRATTSQKANFENIIWNTNPQFVDLNSNENFTYNFQLQSSSPAIDAGNNNYPVSSDIKGRTRSYNGTYDIGCYEWYEE